MNTVDTQVRSGLSEQEVAVAHVLQDKLGLFVRNNALEALTLLLQHDGPLTTLEIDHMGLRDMKDEFMGSLNYLNLVCRTKGGFELTDRALSCFADLDR